MLNAEGRRQAWLFLAVVATLFVCFMIPLEYGLRAYRDSSANDQLRETLEQANRIRALFESEINQAAFLATGVESYIVAREGQLDSVEIQRILSLVFQRGRHFRNIGIAPDNRIAWVFPLAGNEAAVGLDYRTLAAQWPGIQRTIDQRSGTLDGPLDLVQGGRGLIYRSPIYIDNAYWGLLSTVIDADSLFAYLRSVAGDLAPLIALRKVGSDGQSGEVFFGEASIFEQPLDSLPVLLPGTRWQMAIQAPLTVRSGAVWHRLVQVALALFMAVMLGLALRLFWQRNLLRQLDAQVRERTEELQRSHDLLDSVLAAARSFAIVATDPQGTIMLFNKGAERLLGYRADDMIGKRSAVSLLLSEEIRARARSLEAELGRPLEGDEVFTLRARQGREEMLMLHYRHHDGHLIPVQAVVSAIRGSEGEILGYLGIAEDVTERLRNETLKNQFISTVSHELRTPLTAITGALGLAHNDSLGVTPDFLRPLLDIAFNNSERLAVLVNDLLDMEKLMAGRMTLDPHVQAVSELVPVAVENLQGLADQQEVTVELGPLPPALIRVDASRLHQILANLLSNAIKFSPTGGTVRVTTETGGHRLRISVIDQGQGVPADFLPHLFQRFSQADGGDSRRRAGTGLGLAISKELTEQMGGHIGYSAAAKAGSCFWVEFDLCKVPADANQA